MKYIILIVLCIMSIIVQAKEKKVRIKKMKQMQTSVWVDDWYCQYPKRVK